jgi:hypothetical protein
MNEEELEVLGQLHFFMMPYFQCFVSLDVPWQSVPVLQLNLDAHVHISLSNCSLRAL